MNNSRTLRAWLTIAVCAFALLAGAASASAQGSTTVGAGGGVAANQANTFTATQTFNAGGASKDLVAGNLNGILFVDGTHFATLAAALAQCPTAGCRVFDTVTENWTANPFSGITVPSDVTFGCGTWTSTVTIVLPPQTRVHGCGWGNAGSNAGTTIEAAASFTSGGVLFQYASSATQFGIFLSDMAIDCNNINCTAVQNNNAQELSGGNDLWIKNVGSGICLDTETANAQNSGPWTNIDCTIGTSGAAGSLCVKVNGVAQFRGIDSMTCGATTSGTKPSTGIQLDGYGVGAYTRIHVEGVTDGFLIGANAATTGVYIASVNSFSNVTNVVHISNAQSNASINLSAITSNGATNLIKDDEFSTTMTGGASGVVAQYVLGAGTGGVGTRISSDNVVGTRFQTGVTVAAFSTTGNCSSSASPASCGGNAAGSVALAAGATSLQVNDSGVDANSQIMITEDSSLGSRLGVTCNTTTGRGYTVSARTAGSNFTISSSVAPVTNPACLSFQIIN